VRRINRALHQPEVQLVCQEQLFNDGGVVDQSEDLDLGHSLPVGVDEPGQQMRANGQASADANRAARAKVGQFLFRLVR